MKIKCMERTCLTDWLHIYMEFENMSCIFVAIQQFILTWPPGTLPAKELNILKVVEIYLYF